MQAMNMHNHFCPNCLNYSQFLSFSPVSNRYRFSQRYRRASHRSIRALDVRRMRYCGFRSNGALRRAFRPRFIKQYWNLEDPRLFLLWSGLEMKHNSYCLGFLSKWFFFYLGLGARRQDHTSKMSNSYVQMVSMRHSAASLDGRFQPHVGH